MTKIDYAALRLDPRWQRKRLEIMGRDHFKCLHCTDGKSTLNVHHAYYVLGRMPWDYPDFALETLCEVCHKKEQARSKTELSSFEGSIASAIHTFKYIVSLDAVSSLIHDWRRGACDDEYLLQQLRKAADPERKECFV